MIGVKDKLFQYIETFEKYSLLIQFNTDIALTT